MKILHPPHPSEIHRMTTDEMRRQFLLEDLFVPGEIRLVHTGLDRLIVGGAMPGAELQLDSSRDLRSRFFHERRETGVINLGDPGEIVIDDEHLPIDRMGCVYIGMGAQDVWFRSCPGGQSIFYLLSCPAHRGFPARRARIEDAEVAEIGSSGNASSRKIYRYIHENGIESCQLVMGFTVLSPGNVWNTWPPHTHERRSEIYLYFDLGENIVMHFMGEAQGARHLVVRDRQAILSPPWSIHCGAGTGAYRFVWGMAGENQSFEDMDAVNLADLK